MSTLLIIELKTLMKGEHTSKTKTIDPKRKIKKKLNTNYNKKKLLIH